jgi:predicted transcriptional regulator
MATKGISVRLDDEVLAWLDRYAAERGTTRTALLETAIANFADDAERGVPELRRRLKEQAANDVADAEQGVGVCPKRLPGLGHVWSGVKASGDGTNPCLFCGAPGRQARDKEGRPVGPEGSFERATRERGEMFAMLAQPKSVKAWGKS